MTVLSDKRIIEALATGRVVIQPWDARQLSTSSYDVRLGEFYYRERQPLLSNDMYNILQPEQVARVWGTPCEAERADACLSREVMGDTIGGSDRVILLRPGETILAHTQEFIGGRGDVTSMMKARSSLGRNFIRVCLCAGWGDVGYVNRWTMEISNGSQHYTVPLVVGTRVAQIVFMETGDILSGDYTEKGAYQQTDDVSRVMREWTPEQMLPKMRR
jgi:dCTP deaminase